MKNFEKTFLRDIFYLFQSVKKIEKYSSICIWFIKFDWKCKRYNNHFFQSFIHLNKIQFI